METTHIYQASDLVNNAINLDRATEVPIFWGLNKEPLGSHKAIYNSSQRKVAQVVSKNYKIIQHADVVQAIGEVLEELNIPIEGILNSFGHQIRGDLVFKNHDGYTIKEPNSDIQLGFRFVNSYNKSTSFRLELFGYRLVCQNGMALGQALRQVREAVFHMGEMKTLDKLKNIVRKFILRIPETSGTLMKYINSCLKDSRDFQSITKLLEELLQHKKHRNKICELLGISVIEVYDKKTKTRKFSYVLEDPAKQSISRWELYNALTDYASHNELSINIENKIQEVAQKVLKKSFEDLIVVEQQ